MIIGIGTDLLNMERLDGELQAGENSAFLRLVYTAAEREEAGRRASPRSYYATRFAGKEAVFKSLGQFPGEARLSDIEILTGEHREPVVTLHGALSDYARALGVTRVHLSLSYDGELAIAYAVAEA